MAGVDLTLCGEISYYKKIVNQIKQNVLKGINPPRNLVSFLSNLNLNRVLRHELNIFSLDPPNYQPTHNSDKVLNPYRLGLDLTVHEYQRESNYHPINQQLGTGSKDGPCIAVYPAIHCGDKVLNPYRAGSDLTAQRNGGKFVSLPPILQSNVRSTIEPSNLDFSKSMTQFLGSPGDLNKNPREGSRVVAACSDNWRQTMGTHLTSHEDGLSKQEYNLSGCYSF